MISILKRKKESQERVNVLLWQWGGKSVDVNRMVIDDLTKEVKLSHA